MTKFVSASVVRDFLLSDEGQTALLAAGLPTNVGTRGRHNPDHIALFNKSHKGKKYEPKVAEAATITVRVAFKDKAGRKNSKPVTVTHAEAREALGMPTSRKGRIPRGLLAEALSEA